MPKGAFDFVFVGAAADVEEVGGVAAGVLDDVHGGHGETCTVDEAANVAVEVDVGDVVVGGLGLHGVFLGDVADLVELLVAEGSVVVKIQLGVEGDDAAVRGDGEGVDLREGAVVLLEEAVEIDHELGGGADELRFEVHAIGQLAGPERAGGR